MKNIFLLCTILLCICSCNTSVNNTEPKPTVDILAAHLDTTVSPGEDFFEYANGGWIKQNPIPASESGWGIGNLVQDEIYNRLLKINTDAESSHAPEGNITQKIGDFWYSAMDTNDLNKQGLSPLKNDLDKIAAIRNSSDLINEVADLKMKGVNCLFGDYVAQDDKNSDVMAYKLDQGGLGMPNRDYYFKTDARTANIRKAYKEYLIKIFKQLGDDSVAAQKATDAVYNLETKLASASRKLEDLRDPYRNYNKMSGQQLSLLAPVVNWDNYTKDIGIKKLDSVIVGQPEFYKALNNELNSTPIADWKNYLQFHLIRSFSNYLDSTSFNNAFNFIRILAVQKSQGRDGKGFWMLKRVQWVKH